MKIEAKDIVVKDRIELPGRGVCVVTHVMRREYAEFPAYYEIEFGGRFTMYCAPLFKLNIAEPEPRIVPSDSVKVDYPQCPRYRYDRPVRKRYDSDCGNFGLPGSLRR